ncbi:aldo/keto reductase [Sphaerisporangium fuscum]|uniref:aldo/keto reductase n=1 Tax=Sphaerisporangium fuscum TaxID=2835868 RepID=UPI001BDC4BAC|nr:aldo/keto reductase [Sphaerisporangium fuscum]
MNTILGKTGLEVSRIAHGTWELSGHWGTFDEDEAINAIRHSRNLGVNVFDTAHAYGWGAAERVLGRALRDDLKRRRDEVVIVTKGGMGIDDDGRPFPDSGRAMLRVGIENSLISLGVDHIDIYLVHVPDPDFPYDEVAGFLQEFVEAGVIRHVGVSNYDTEQMTAFAAGRPVEVLQAPYNLLWRESQDTVLPFARGKGIGVLTYAPLANGLLSGALTGKEMFAGDWRAFSGNFRGERYEKTLKTASKLAAFAAGELNVTLPQLAVAWTLANGMVDCAIVGTRQAGHIEQAVRAADLRLGAAELAEIDHLIND